MIVNCVAYQDGKRLGDIPLEGIEGVLKQDNTFVWIGLYEPTEELLRDVKKSFGLHELAVEDAHKAHQRPKIEQYGSSLFVVLQTAKFAPKGVHFGETHLFVGEKFLVSIRHGSAITYAKVRERCENMPEKLSLGTGFVFYALMDFVVDNYQPIVDMYQIEFESLERSILKSDYDRLTIEQLYDLKYKLLLLRNAATPLNDICNTLQHSPPDIIPAALHPYFRDISDHANRVIGIIDNLGEMLMVAMQVNLALVSVGQNEIVKKLAGWGAIVTLPTMVFSWYGMNFKNMPELEWSHGYPVVLVGVLIGCVLLYRRLKRVGWL
jgi:magnesium transporter